MLQAPSPTKATVSPAQLALVLADREQVGEQLAGVELVGERVDDRHAGVRGHLLERASGRRCATRSPRPAGRARGRRRRPTRACRCRPASRRPSSGSRRARRCRRRTTPGCAGSACRRSSRRCAGPARLCESYGACLQRRGQARAPRLLGRAQVVVAEEVPGHARAPGRRGARRRGSRATRPGTRRPLVAEDQRRGEPDRVGVRSR